MKRDPYSPPSDAELLAGLKPAAEQFRDMGITEADLRKHLEAIIGHRLPLGPTEALRERVAAIEGGEYVSVPLPWGTLTDLALPLLPGNLVVFAGGVGSSKSLMILQAALFWLEAGLDIAVLAMEGDRESHLARALAQLAGVADVTTPAWVRAHGADMRELLDQHEPTLERLGRHWVLAKNENIDTQSQALTWVERQAAAGKRVIVVDPVSLLTRTGEAWTADQMFVKALKKTAETHGVSILCITHPQRGVAEPSRANLSGGAAWERHADVILALQIHDPRSSRICTPCGTDEREHNRTLLIEKARHGAGTGKRLAMQFDASSLTIRELGLIVKNKKGQDHDK